MGLVQARLYPVGRGRRGAPPPPACWHPPSGSPVLVRSAEVCTREGGSPRLRRSLVYAYALMIARNSELMPFIYLFFGLRSLVLLCPHDREELRAHAVHLSGAGHFWVEATSGAQATFGRRPPARIYSRSLVYAYALMIAKKCELMPFTFWAQATFGIRPLLGSGHLWAHATSAKSIAGMRSEVLGLRPFTSESQEILGMPLTSDSQQNSGFTKVAYDTVAVTYDSLIAFIVRPQGQHGEISPPGQAGRATARSRPRPRPPRACSTFRLH